MTRILVFSPYQLWTYHLVYEQTIAKSCQVRGATVEYLLCDGLPECDQHWDSKSNSSRPLDLCQRCQTRAKTNLGSLGFSFRKLGEFVSPAERSAAFAWAQNVKPSELRDASFEGSPIGQWILSSVISYFRQYPPDLNNWHVVSVYRGFLFSGAIVAIALRNYLKVNSVDAAILFNGRQSITRVALEIFQQHGVRVLTHERAEYQRGHINVRSNAHCMSPEPFRSIWNTWGHVPLTRESLDSAFQWLIQRRYGANLAWIPFNKSSGGNSSVKTKLNLSRDKRLWALFTSSTDEVAGDPLMQGPFESQAEWVEAVVQWVRMRDDVELVIKVHPNLGGNYYIGKATDELRTYEQMKSSLPNNVRIVMPEDSMSAYALAEEADVGLTFGSTIGLEMAMLGKPVLLASRALYEHGSKILTVRSKESLPEMLEKCLNASPSQEIQRQAYRLASYYMFKTELPFPRVKMLDVFEAEANYAGDQDLASGKDDSLDHICDFLIHGSPLHDSPTTADLSRTTADEDAFFKQLASSPDPLKSNHLERWLRWKSMGRTTIALVRRLPFGAGDALLDLGRGRWHAFLKSVETEGTGSHKQPESNRSKRSARLS